MIVSLHDRHELLSFFSRDPLLNIYQLGDLDPFFWSRTTWYGWVADDELIAVLLLYASPDIPTVLLLTRDEDSAASTLMKGVLPLLPRRFYAHLGPGCAEPLRRSFDLEHRGRFLKLGLLDRHLINGIETDDVVRLGAGDLEDLLAFYGVSYPENWFDPRMVATGRYFGIRRPHEPGNAPFLAAAGVHVVSTAYGVAALGNIASAPDHRREGLARRVTAQLCRDLLEDVEHIGLNVSGSNHAAISCYRRLGFSEVASYDEYTVTGRANDAPS